MKKVDIFNIKKSRLIIDLGIHPYADTFISIQKNKSDNVIKEPLHPLRCRMNIKSGLIFNEIITSSRERYNLFDYSYTSSNSKFSRSYWVSYAKFLKKNYKNEKNVLEVGSNDGFLLKHLKTNRNKVIGIDASKFMAKISNQKKIKTYSMLFTKKNAKKILVKEGKFDLIICNNVFNHANDPIDFILSAEILLKDQKYLIIEVPYWKNLIKKGQFDQIYHEHVTYWTIKSFYNIIKFSKLNIVDIIETDYNGGSIRFICQKKTKHNFDLINKYLYEENRIKLFDYSTYKNFERKVFNAKKKFLQKIYFLKNQGYPIIGIGAAAKANTLLNYLKLDYNVLDFITDASKYKIKKQTPLSRIPIKRDDDIKVYSKKFYAIILSWNISKILKKKLIKINNKINFINFKL